MERAHRVNRALRGETSRAHFPVSMRLTQPILYDISTPGIVETKQCLPCTYKQHAGRAMSTRARVSSRDTPRMHLPSSSSLPLCLLSRQDILARLLYA
jgi:hypothetical protein